MAYHLGVDVERLGYLDDVRCGVFVGIDLHAMSHVEHLVHLLPVGLALLVYHLEQRWGGEEVVFHHMQVIYKMQHLRLRAAAAVYHAVDLRPVTVQYLAYHGCISPCRRKHHVTCIHACHLGRLGQLLVSGIDHLGGQCLVIRHRVFLGIDF